MKGKGTNVERRRMLRRGMAVIVSVPLVQVFRMTKSYATTLPHLSETDRAAQALQYSHDAKQAPRQDKYGTPAEQQFCRNCRFIQADQGEWRPCQLFPGKAVNAGGWCTSWAKG